MAPLARTNPPFPLVAFFLLAFALTWANWVPRALAGRGLIDLSVADGLAVVAGYGPALAAVVVSGLFGGGAAVRRLLGRLLVWRAGAVWYAVALFLPAAMMLGAHGLHLATGGSPAAGQPAPEPAEPFWQHLLLLVVMFTVGFDGLGEELGWRGFALPRLQARYTALTASLILGAFWASWHLPYALTPGTAMADRPFVSHLPGMFASAVLFTWLFNNTRGSVLLAILFHAAGNVTVNALPRLIPGVADVGALGPIVQWAVVLAVVAANGPAHLTRNPSGRVTAEDPGPDRGPVGESAADSVRRHFPTTPGPGGEHLVGGPPGGG